MKKKYFKKFIGDNLKDFLLKYKSYYSPYLLSCGVDTYSLFNKLLRMIKIITTDFSVINF